MDVAAAQIAAKRKQAEDKVREALARERRVMAEYRPKHPELLELSDRFLAPALREAFRIGTTSFTTTTLPPCLPLPSAVTESSHQFCWLSGTKEALLSVLTPQTETGIYSFELFTQEFCALLIEEMEHMQKYPHLNER